MIVFHDAVSQEQLEDEDELAELQVRERGREGGREGGREEEGEQETGVSLHIFISVS